MSNTYMPIIKTGEAEVRAVENSSYLKDNENIIPIIELTRGRKTRWGKIPGYLSLC